MYSKLHNRTGVSPVIAVVLVVGVTVILSAMVGFLLLDFGSQPTSSTAGVSFSETSDGTIVQLTAKGQNSETVIVSINGNETRLSSVGESVTITESGTATVTSVTDSGDETVIQRRDISSGSSSVSNATNTTNSSQTLTGTVKINPVIEGATVQAINSEDTVIESVTTDSNGKYAFTVSNESISSVHVIVSDADGGTETSHNFYSFGEKTVPENTSRLDFDFGSSEFGTPIDTTINGSSVSVIYQQRSGSNLVGTIHQLQALRVQEGADYTLARDIDASSTTSWNGGSGFEPIGTVTNTDNTYFYGTLNGKNHTVSNLYIDRPSDDYVGLIGGLGTPSEEYGEVTNLSVIDADITGRDNVGVIGQTYTRSPLTLSGYEPVFTHIFVNGVVSGEDDVGGFIGSGENDAKVKYIESEMDVTGRNSVGGIMGSGSFGGSLEEVTSSGDVSGTGSDVGGLIGNSRIGYANNITSTSTVTGDTRVGGLFGSSESASLRDVVYSGTVSGTTRVGGIIGFYGPFNGPSTSSSTVETVLMNGTVSGTASSTNVGGLVGLMEDDDARIRDAAVQGPVSGDTIVGGIAGTMDDRTRTSRVVVTGSVTGGTDSGGLVGDLKSGSSLSRSYWDSSDSSVSQIIGIENGNVDPSVTTVTTSSTLIGDSARANTNLDFVDTWNTVDGGYPIPAGGDGPLEICGDPTAEYTVSSPETQSPKQNMNTCLENIHNNMDTTTSGEYIITNEYELQAINHDLSADYVLGNNIDLSGTTNWNAGNGFTPIGPHAGEIRQLNGDDFTGSLDGQGYTISNLHIDLESDNGVGLFGGTDGATISNLIVTNADINGKSYTGILAGQTEYSTIQNVEVSGTVTANGKRVGGLIGDVDSGDVQNSHASIIITASDDDVGGLIGTSDGTVTSSSTSGTVSAPTGTYIGGLIGSVGSFGDTTKQSSSSVDVSGESHVGGLIGISSSGIKTSYATGDVTHSGEPGTRIGGLVGVISRNVIEESYSTGTVDGGPNQYVGGLVGRTTVEIKNSFSTSPVTGTQNPGGLIGNNPDDISITTSYWDTQQSGQSSSDGGKPLNTTQMQGDTYNTNFETDIVNNPSFNGQPNNYPKLTWESE